MQLGIIGTGYVGLVTGACLAEVGHTVFCIDRDDSKIARLNNGEVPIYEPGLADIVARNRRIGRLQFCTRLADCIGEVEALFLAVGTPPKADHEADLSAVEAASREIGQLMTRPLTVVTKSTVPVGTSEKIREAISKGQAKAIPFFVASNPEFLREGAAVGDFMQPDRIVVGVDGPESEKVLRDIYEPFTRTGVPLLVTNLPSAEVIKYAANAFLATKISFINEVANFCEKTGASIDDVSRGVGLDARIGPRFLQAGLGYGGSCFPKDVKAFIATARQYGEEFSLLEATEKINHKQRHRFLKKLRKYLPSLKGKTIAVWGLAFKPETDDTREAPAHTIVSVLLARGARVRAYDPVVKDFPYDIEYAETPEACYAGADALLILTDWSVFRDTDFHAVHKSMRRPIVLDGRNMFQPEVVREHGITYESVGRL